MKERAWEAGVESLMQTQRHKAIQFSVLRKKARLEGRESRGRY